MARVYADVNEHMPRSYWDYDSVNISWGVLENYEIVRKIGEKSSNPVLLRDVGDSCRKLWTAGRI
jgi:hypothetical protein